MRKPGLGLVLLCACMAAAETSLTGGQTPDASRVARDGA